jgi:hypothetical protein
MAVKDFMDKKTPQEPLTLSVSPVPVRLSPEERYL